ncbi:MAG: hypothetical protein HXY40_15410 [Chloroflexi bacterium]|nr:hypothetical protein [Chloroflexota bacterium]
MRYTRILLIGLAALFLAACTVGQTGDTANDPQAAQRFLPDVPGYTATNATSVSSALNTVGGGASALTGNPALTVVIERVDALVQCYTNVGAVAARIYTPTTFNISNPQMPGIGAVAVINQDRLRDNFLACVTNNSGQDFSAQAAVEPCYGSGTFTDQGNTFSYVYAASAPDLCTAFERAFTR